MKKPTDLDKPGNTHRLNVQLALTSPLVDKVESYAKKWGVTPATVVRVLMSEGLDAREQEGKANGRWVA